MRTKFIGTTILAVVGAILLVPYPNIESDTFLLGWNLCAPFVFFIIDRLFTYISMNAYDRDYILWLRHSDEIDDSLTGINLHVRFLDVVLSLLALVCAFGLTVIGAVIAHGLK